MYVALKLCVRSSKHIERERERERESERERARECVSMSTYSAENAPKNFALSEAVEPKMMRAYDSLFRSAGTIRFVERHQRHLSPMLINLGVFVATNINATWAVIVVK